MEFTVRTDEELEQSLSQLAELEGNSRQEIVRRAVVERHARSGHTARVRDSADRMMERWPDVLDRFEEA